MDNKEDILDALEEFSRKPTSEIPPLLDQYIQRVAATGETIFPWNKVKPLFAAKLDNCIEKFHEKAPTDKLPPCPNVENISYSDMKILLINAVNNFNSAPFTIQRICELITDPHKHYKRTDKFMRGIEKNIMVVSCVDTHGVKIVNDGKSVMNGLDTNGEAKTPNRKSSCSFLRLFAPPPAPSNSPVTSGAESRITPESSSPTGPTPLSPVCLWPYSRFMGNNDIYGPLPQVAAAAASSAPPEMSSISSEMSSSKSSESGGEMSSMTRLHPSPETSSAEDKGMEVDETPSSSDQMTPPAINHDKSTKNNAESTPDQNGSGDASSVKVEKSSSSDDRMSSDEAMSSESEEASSSQTDEVKSETIPKAEPSVSGISEEPSSSVGKEPSSSKEVEEPASSDEKEPAASVANEDAKESPENEVSSLGENQEKCAEESSAKNEAEATSEAEDTEKPNSPVNDSPEVSQSGDESKNDNVSADSVATEEATSNNVESSSAAESVNQTVDSSDKSGDSSPSSSECVSSSESSSTSAEAAASEDISSSPSSSTNNEDSKDSEEKSEDSTSSTVSDSTTPSEAPSEEAMEQD